MIRYKTGSNICGTIATTDIPAKTAIMHITKLLIIWCPDFKVIKEEMSMCKQSKQFEYFDFEDSSRSCLPLQWGRSNGPRSSVQELQGLPPNGDTHHHVTKQL
jgi:hypothetical protein